jgi:cyclase
MLRPRVIPTLLVSGGAVVKTRAFDDARYVGDPINAVRIFSDLGADELVLLDIDATRLGRCISAREVQRIGEEADMPLAVGGGIRTVAQMRELVAAGAEKVVLGTAAVESPGLVAQAADALGSSTIVVCIDVRTTASGREVRVRNGRVRAAWKPEALASHLAASGAGEIIVQSIDRDGTRSGYDVELVRSVSSRVVVPVVALGGAGSVADLARAHREGGASALAAGTMFVLRGSRRGVLLSYPAASVRATLT